MIDLIRIKIYNPRSIFKSLGTPGACIPDYCTSLTLRGVYSISLRIRRWLRPVTLDSANRWNRPVDDCLFLIQGDADSVEILLTDIGIFTETLYVFLRL